MKRAVFAFTPFHGCRGKRGRTVKSSVAKLAERDRPATCRRGNPKDRQVWGGLSLVLSLATQRKNKNLIADWRQFPAIR